jgi:predicted GIY-YIG superfamily endonuclease
MRWVVYIIYKSNQIYVGMTSDLQNRLRQHGWPDLLHVEFFTSKECASQREIEIKRWSNQKKRDIINAFSQQ